MNITGLAGLAVLALAKQFMDLLKYANNRQWNGVLTIAAAWIVGTLTVLMVSFTQLGKGDIFGVTLADQGIYGRIILGMVAGSATGLTHDLFKSINNKSNYEKPPLFPQLTRKEPVPSPVPQVTQSAALAPTGETDNPDV